jgi:hypothetical protein
MTLSFSSLSGGTSFTVVTSTGGSKTATLDKSYPAGTYLIESKANDTNLEIYLGASDGTQVGTATAGAKTITASASFLYVTTVNADANDAVIFTLKSAATLATKTDAVWAPPTITDITPSGLPNANDTTTITGTNFATNVDVKFRKSDDSTLVNPKSTVRGSATSIIATRPDSFSPTDSPYDVIVTNPSTNLTATSLNAITAGAVPVWVTSTTLNAATVDTIFSQTISATDADGGSSITYAIVSGALPTGLSLNTSTGAITGTPTGSAGSYTVTISATDSGSNSVNRTFTQQLIPVSLNSIEVILIAGGGGGGQDSGGGGGAGGLLYTSSQSVSTGISYNIVIGAGGNGSVSYSDAMSGIDSTFSGSGTTTLTAVGGGGGGGIGGSYAAKSGGSGGGGSGGGSGGAGTGVSGQGYAGGTGDPNGPNYPAGGGGGAGGVGGNAVRPDTNGAGGVGSSTYSTWLSATNSGLDVGGTRYIAGGGGGTNGSYYGVGGSGGGGAGALAPSSAGQPGISNTGSGGGGGTSGTTLVGGNGGNGLCIIRYPDNYSAASSTSGSPSVFTSGGYRYYKFTANGSITF